MKTMNVVNFQNAKNLFVLIVMMVSLSAIGQVTVDEHRNVGVGFVNPTVKLDVDGVIKSSEKVNAPLFESPTLSYVSLKASPNAPFNGYSFVIDPAYTGFGWARNFGSAFWGEDRKMSFGAFGQREYADRLYFDVSENADPHNTTDMVLKSTSTGARLGLGINTPSRTLSVAGGVSIEEDEGNMSAIETSNAPLYIASKKNSVSMFLGIQESTTTYQINDRTGDIRFNGAGVGWGDLAYYPNGGTDSQDYGHFRFSRAGSNISETPNARVGVGSLYVKDDANINGTLSFKNFVSNPSSATGVVRLVGSPDAPYFGYGITIDDSYTGGYARNFGSIYYNDLRVATIGVYSHQNANTRMYFDVSNNASPSNTDDMVLKKIGDNAYLGIGTTTPSTTLDVNGTTKISGKLTLENVINLQAKNEEPTNPPPVIGDIYLDNGDNTMSGNPSLRYYNGIDWIDL